MMRSFAAQNASNFAVTPGEVTIFAERAANVNVTSADAQTMRLTVTSIPTGKGLTWTTSDKSIVQVTDSGDITAASSGEANITVTHTDGRQAACKVKVVAAPTENWAASADTKWYDDNKTSSAFTITTAAQLAGLAKLVNAGSEDFSDKTITLSNDIDLSAGEWTAIGTYAQPFKGTFNGGGHAITGLYINEAGAEDQGLFGQIGSMGAVKGIRLSGCVTGGDFVGGVAGQNSRGVQDLNINGSTVTNCTMTGSVNGTSGVGGAAGVNFGAVTNCAATGSVTGTDGSVGGVAGKNMGVVGVNNGGVVSNSAMTGSVNGKSSVGGVAGFNHGGGTVTNSAMTGGVNGTSNVGGVAGYNMNGGTVSNSAMTGSVNGTSNFGGVAGYNMDVATVTNCGWLADAHTIGIGNDENSQSTDVTSFDAAGTPVTTILFDDYELKAAVNTSSEMAVRTYPGASAALKAVASPDIAKIENFAISGDVTAARVTGLAIGSADVTVSALAAAGARDYKAKVQAHLTVLPGPPKPEPEPEPEPGPDPKPAPGGSGSSGCSAGAGGIAMLAVAAAAMRGRKTKR
ncbi:MAG: Ig-like domain-containing protein [Cloacibacillus sp.]